MATYGRVLVLAWADILAVYAMWLLMAYLTDVWRLEITNASTIVTILWGLFALFPLFQAFIVDSLTSTYGMLFISTASFSAGLGLLTMSTPPLAQRTGSCSEYKPECIGQPQKALLYTAVPLIAFGLAGNLTCCSTFIAERANTTGQTNVTWKNCVWFVYGDLPRLVVTLVAVLGLPYVNPWSLRFGIPAICTLVATLLFFSTLCSYKNSSKANGSPLTILFRVFVAAFSKLFYRIPTDPKDLFEIQNPQRYSVPHTMSLRCLDKAAIVTPTKTLEEQEKNTWRLCRVTEVEETKKVVRMVPLWTTFILCGVVKAVGYTYFIEQLNHMNPKVGRLKVPLVVIIWLYEQAKLKFAELSSVVFITCLGLKKPAAPTFGIAASMILAILCCITAAKVESRRLGVVQMHGLVDKHDERVPMTMFWLLPQFLLLGAFEGVFNSSAGFFFVDLSSMQRFLSLSPGSIQRFVDQSQVSMQRYLGFFLSGVWGVGILGSILSVYVVGKISEKGGKQMNWFQHDLNQSRLDKYYWTLAWLMAVNLVVFIVVAVIYRYKESKLKDEELGDVGFDNVNVTRTFTLNCCCWNYEYNY
ncbi:hypothetical protein ABFS82_10G019000 [Erythranthe guttata]